MDRTRPRAAAIVTIVILALFGLAPTIGGGWLIALGGSPYYLIAGLALLIAAFLVWRQRSEALWLYAVLLLGTLIWAIWEVGLDFWSLAPRGDLLVPLGIWLLLPFAVRGLRPDLGAARGA